MSVNPIVQEVQEVKDGVISLPPPSRNLNVPLLSRGDVADFVQAVGGRTGGELSMGQILRHPDGVSNVRITHPCDQTVLWAYCLACQKVVNEATMDKHLKTGNKITCKNHPSLPRSVDTAAVPLASTAEITGAASTNSGSVELPPTFGIEISSGVAGDGGDGHSNVDTSVLPHSQRNARKKGAGRKGETKTADGGIEVEVAPLPSKRIRKPSRRKAAGDGGDDGDEAPPPQHIAVPRALGMPLTKSELILR